MIASVYCLESFQVAAQGGWPQTGPGGSLSWGDKVENQEGRDLESTMQSTEKERSTQRELQKSVKGYSSVFSLCKYVRKRSKAGKGTCRTFSEVTQVKE